MKLQRLNVKNPDFTRLDEMLTAMSELLENYNHSALSFEELLSFQDSDGSFKLFDSFLLPSDAWVDFCCTPTYIGSAILMREHLSGRKELTPSLIKALEASLNSGFHGHGYEADKGCISAMNIFIKGGLLKFLETQREICPQFQQNVYNILHDYNSRLLRNCSKGTWGEDYREDWQNIVDKLVIKKRLYVSYGSNMDKSQMTNRCPGASVLGKTYLEGWELTMPFYANIEPVKGKRTPALVWEITADDERALNRYEGYPNRYCLRYCKTSNC